MKEAFALYAAAFFFGSAFGSFFYTLALRLSSDLFTGRTFKLLTQPSACDACGASIRWYAMIPVAGYLLTGRRCPACRIALRATYPVSEAAAGLLLCLLISSFGISFYTLSLFLLICVAAVIALVDCKKMMIPDVLVAVFLLLSIYPAYSSGDWKSNAWGILILGGFFFVIILLFPGGFGGGDMKFAAALGFFAGMELAIVLLETALIIGSIFGILYAIKTRKGFRVRIPFAPFLFAGLVTAVFWGREIVMLYYSFF